MPRSNKSRKFSGVSHTYSPYSLMPTEKQNTSLYAAKNALLDMGETLPKHATKKNIVAKLHRLGYDAPQFDEEDAECAARFPQFSDMPREDVLLMAEMLGVNTSGMAKIDACHALHQIGLETEDHVDEVVEMINASPVVQSSPVVKPAEPVKVNMPSRSELDAQIRKDLITPPAPTFASTFGSDKEGKKQKRCKKSKVKGADGKMKMLMRDKKGRFCKKSKKMSRRSRK
jgi:hypothetical protein